MPTSYGSHTGGTWSTGQDPLVAGSLEAVLRSIAATAATALVLAACGTSDRQDVARVYETYAHSLAAGDGQAACATVSPRGRLREDRSVPGSFCTRLGTRAQQPTPAARGFYRAATAVVTQLKGDRAVAYLKAGGCTAIPTGLELARSASGQWQISRLSLT